MNIYTFLVESITDVVSGMGPPSTGSPGVGAGTRIVAVPSVRQMRRQETMKRLGGCGDEILKQARKTRRTSSLVYDVDEFGGDIQSTPVRVPKWSPMKTISPASPTEVKLMQKRKRVAFSKVPSWLRTFSKVRFYLTY